jgi:hypothetical protein
MRCIPCKNEKKKSVLREWYKKTYVKKGYNQLGEANNNWKNGVGTYKIKMADVHSCERCGSTEFLLVHHKDADRGNNDRSNLEKLCKRCHQLEHDCYSNLPAADVVGRKRSEWLKSHPEAFDENGKFRHTS